MTVRCSKYPFEGENPVSVEAVKLVIAALRERPVITFRQFYDGRAETEALMKKALPDFKYDGVSDIDRAIGVLSKFGWVTSHSLADLLPDENPNYAVLLTSKGKKALTGKRSPVVREHDDCTLSIRAGK